jgi:hypothetical protein
MRLCYWLDEPRGGLRNAALLELTTQDDQPVDAEATLLARSGFGGKAKDLNLRPLAGQPALTWRFSPGAAPASRSAAR